MTIAVTFRTRRAVLVAPVALIASLSSAAARADQPAGEPTFTTTPSTAPAADYPADPLLGPIERLPGWAYPSDPVVGIPFGSLELSSGKHGLQFPFYPKTGIPVSGYAWVDTGFAHKASGEPNVPDQKQFVQEGRMVLRVSPTWSDGRWFAQAQAELVGEEDQSKSPPLAPTVDDAWVKAGLWKVFDVQAGRFQGWEVYHYGMGLDVNTQERRGAADTPQIYGLSFLWDYPQTKLGALAVHYYPKRWLRFELAARYGDGSSMAGPPMAGTPMAGLPDNEIGVRPVGILDMGFVKVKVGYEYTDSTPKYVNVQNDLKQQGWGASVQGILFPYLEGGINAAYGQQRQTLANATSGDGSFDTYSLGAFANFRIIDNLLVGGGINYTYLKNETYDATLFRDGDYDQWQGFGAIQYVLWKHLLIKDVFAYALSNQRPAGVTPFQDIVVSDRVRLEVLF
jgi:hypothetical protein